MDLGPAPIDEINLKQCVKEARERVEAARLERLRREEEQRLLSEALKKSEIQMAIRPYVRDISKLIKRHSEDGRSKFTYRFPEKANNDFTGPHYDFKVVAGSEVDWFLRFLSDSGVLYSLHANHERDYDSWDYVYTTTYMIEVEF